eukprot:4435722-Alexandrium_andersonii.AAC.1
MFNCEPLAHIAPRIQPASFDDVHDVPFVLGYRALGCLTLLLLSQAVQGGCDLLIAVQAVEALEECVIPKLGVLNDHRANVGILASGHGHRVGIRLAIRDALPTCD